MALAELGAARSATRWLAGDLPNSRNVDGQSSEIHCTGARADCAENLGEAVVACVSHLEGLAVARGDERSPTRVDENRQRVRIQRERHGNRRPEPTRAEDVPYAREIHWRRFARSATSCPRSVASRAAAAV